MIFWSSNAFRLTLDFSHFLCHYVQLFSELLFFFFTHKTTLKGSSSYSHITIYTAECIVFPVSSLRAAGSETPSVLPTPKARAGGQRPPLQCCSLAGVAHACVRGQECTRCSAVETRGHISSVRQLFLS